MENREGNQDKLLSSIRDLAGSFTASSRDLRDQVAAISGKKKSFENFFIPLYFLKNFLFRKC